MQKPVLLIVLILFFVGGNAKPPKGFCAHPDGLYYKIIRHSSDTTHPVYGDVVYMHLRKHHPNEKDIFDTHILNADKGVELALDIPKRIPDVTQVFLEMSRGDSAVVKIPASMIDSNGSANTYYTYYLRLMDFKPRTVYEKEKKATMEAQRQKDSVLIAAHLANNNITTALIDSYGIAIQKNIITENPYYQTGDTVRMHYKGTLLNGLEFDNSYYREQPLVFVANNKNVIDGLDLALQYFRKGEGGLIIIPSYLGYAERETGKIPPNSVLIFNVEFLP
jgi:FKBP-type peptidyl-prolyl cis-trans isomerase